MNFQTLRTTELLAVEAGKAILIDLNASVDYAPVGGQTKQSVPNLASLKWQVIRLVLSSAPRSFFQSGLG